MTDPPVVVITHAQRRVLGELTRDGASNATIARRLGLSEQTVKCHVKAIYTALGANQRAAIVAMCLRREVVVRTVKRNGAATPKWRPPINHGTWGGYRAHIQRDSDPCDDCTTAWGRRVDNLRVQLADGRRKRWAA